MEKTVVWFKEIDKNDIPLVGGKGANLGEMYRYGIPVPNGFIVTSTAYYEFVEANNIKAKIHQLLDGIDISNNNNLDKVSAKIREMIVNSPIPEHISALIVKYYLSMGKTFKDPLVAIRSSATAEDLPGASFAGQQETFLNIKGEANVVYYVRKCWASLFTSRAIFYRVQNKFDHFKVGIAVPVEQMIQSQKSGIMFTVNPVTNQKDTIVIEAIFGLGELIVQGIVTPDHYEIDKNSLTITHKKINRQDKIMLLEKGKTRMDYMSEKQGTKIKLSDEEILKIAYYGKKLEHHYYFPQDVEWAIEDNKIYIVQTRPITTLNDNNQNDVNNDRHEITHTHVVLMKGDPASPGVASGPVKIIHSAKEIDAIHTGDILVAPQTNPDYIPAMRKVAAIITETGGRTSHAAIVSRELGIPAIVGVAQATKKLSDGQIVTVHGSKGVVYKGGIYSSVGVKSEKYKSVMTNLNNKTGNLQKLKTATKIYVNLADPEKVIEISQKNVDGVGLLRAEFMIAGIGTHPKKFIKDHKQHVFVNSLTEKLVKFCQAFYPRPVIYRATDFRTNEYRNLIGGQEYEPEEANPMLGFRGCYRYISDPAVFQLELAAIKNVRNKHNLKNLWLMIPFIHTPNELMQVKRIVTSEGLNRSSTFKLWMMVELPVNVIILDKFLDVGIDGVSIGSNDLTMLILGIDRDNSDVAQVFDERNPAVLWALEHVIKTCHKRNITVSICGQAPSDYPELVEKLVKWGITSISVNRDVIDSVRETVYLAEKSNLDK